MVRHATRIEPIVPRQHLDAALSIEQESFGHPWDEREFRRTLKQRSCDAYVALQGRRKVVGFAVYELHRERVHLLNLAVATHARRAGVGSELVRRLQSLGRPKIVAEVSEPNLPAQLFLRRHGFVCTRILEGFYGERSPWPAYQFRWSAEDDPQRRGALLAERGQ